MAERWATFDCYGTLIDWNGGIAGELARLWGETGRERLLDRYHELEPQVEAEAFRSYRDVMAETLSRVAVEEGLPLPDDERDALGRSLPQWTPFPEVPAALEELRGRGVRLGILSNTDRDFIAASIARLGVPVDYVVVAEDVESYKPGHAHWERFFADTGAERERHVHVAASLFHDVAPANELGLRSIWINRLGEPAGDPGPTRELPDLSHLADTVDELVAP